MVERGVVHDGEEVGFADVLLEGLDGDLNERMEEDVHLIRQSGIHLRELISDILDMSKIEAGMMELRFEEINVREIAEEMMATNKPVAQTSKKYLDMVKGPAGTMKQKMCKTK